MSKGITWPDAIERRYFVGFPGIYGPGDVLPLEDLGLKEDEATERIKAANLPLTIVDLPKPPVRRIKGAPLPRPKPPDAAEEGATTAKDGED